MEEGSLYGFGLVRYKINKVLVCCEPGLAAPSQLRESMLTLQEGLDVVEFARIVEFPKVLGLLREILPLRESVSLVCDEVRGYRVELRDECGEVDVWRIVSLCLQPACVEGLRTPPRADGLLKLVALFQLLFDATRLRVGLDLGLDPLIQVYSSLHVCASPPD